MSTITAYQDSIAFRPERFNPVVLAENPRVKVILVCLEPGQFIPVHRPGVDMALVVLEGEGLLVAGDRESEVAYLAKQVGITEVFAQQSPEDKLAIVRRETARAKTVVVGDGINDAPALMAATVGIAVGQRSDITSEAAGVVIMDSSLGKLDEFMHISSRMRRIALQSAVGGMVASLVGMGAASAGWLSPVMGAMAQELIDVVAVLNALRAALPPKELTDYQ